jgi:hypothetical protein
VSAQTLSQETMGLVECIVGMGLVPAAREECVGLIRRGLYICSTVVPFRPPREKGCAYALKLSSQCGSGQIGNIFDPAVEYELVKGHPSVEGMSSVDE